MCHVRSAPARGAVYQGSRSGRSTSVIGETVILLQGEVLYRLAVGVLIAVLQITVNQLK